MKTPHDSKITRCPKLGDEMTFAYCLVEAGDLPCARIIACWRKAFDVTALLQSILTSQQWDRFDQVQPKDKMESLLELIEKAKGQT